MLVIPFIITTLFTEDVSLKFLQLSIQSPFPESVKVPDSYVHVMEDPQKPVFWAQIQKTVPERIKVRTQNNFILA